MAFFVDSNVFIEANNRHYGLDFCPAFWDWLLASHHAKKVFSIDKVRDELIGKQDAVSHWVQAAPSSFFMAANAATVVAMGKIAPWLTKNYESAHAAAFMMRADYYLVAEAMARGGVVVTHEVHNEGAKKVKIPTVCKAFGVDCRNPFEMLREEKASFVLFTLPTLKLAQTGAAGKGSAPPLNSVPAQKPAN